MDIFILIEYATLVMWLILFLVFFYYLIRSVRIVQTKKALVVERLGKYYKTLGAGFHFFIPYLDKVVNELDLKEKSLDVVPQECFSADEVKVEVDGVLYISVSDPAKATYGVGDYLQAAVVLAQTTTRSIIGTLELDKTFEEREQISFRVVEALNKASSNWGISIHRYEIKNIKPPTTVQSAMEKQVRAEREKRARIAVAEGHKQSAINTSEGLMIEKINMSEGEKEKLINEAYGKASEITALAEATAESIRLIAEAVKNQSGVSAFKLTLAGELYRTISDISTNGDDEIIMAADLTDPGKLLKKFGLD